MKFNTTLYTAREDSFDIEHPDVSIMSISSEVKIFPSHDGKSHVKILADSKKAVEKAGLVEVVESNGKLIVRFYKKSRTFWGIGDDWLDGLSVELMLPPSSDVKIKTVSGDIEVNQALASLQIGSISSDVKISHNPETRCEVKTVSGDILTHTFSACDYKLKSISGDIRVFVAPDLTVEVDGSSVSGDLNSEISLYETPSESANTGKVVRITTSTISGDFNLVRN